MPIIVTDTPSDFVANLTDLGLPVYDMNTPLAQYLCSVKSFGGNAEASQVIGYANEKIYYDEARKTKVSAQTRNMGRLTTGQGYPEDVILLMEHITDNIEKMRAARELKQKDYFRNPQLDVESILNKVVEQKVSASTASGSYPNIWCMPASGRTTSPTTRPTTGANSSRSPRWRTWNAFAWSFGTTPTSAIDNVTSYNEKTGELLVDICQSSWGANKGPQTNCDVSLCMSPGDTYQGAQQFKIFRAGSPTMPVQKPVYICKMPGLVWQGDLADN